MGRSREQAQRWRQELPGEGWLAENSFAGASSPASRSVLGEKPPEGGAGPEERAGSSCRQRGGASGTPERATKTRVCSSTRAFRAR